MKRLLKWLISLIMPLFISLSVFLIVWFSIMLTPNYPYELKIILFFITYTGYFMLSIDTSKTWFVNYFVPIIGWLYLLCSTFIINRPLFELFPLPLFIIVNLSFVVGYFYKTKAKISTYVSTAISSIGIITYLIFLAPYFDYKSYERIEKSIDFSTFIGKNIILKDSNGNDVKFEDSVNEVIFFEFGFSSCKPCILKIPTIKKLKDKFKSDKRISFVYIIDGNVDDFKTYQVLTKKYADSFDSILYAPKKSMNTLDILLNITGYPFEKIFYNGKSVLTHEGFSDVEKPYYYAKRLDYLTKILN